MAPAALITCKVTTPDNVLLTCNTNLSVVGFGEISRAAAVVSVTLVVIVAGLSYELYEKHFLKLKKAFTVVQNQKV